MSAPTTSTPSSSHCPSQISSSRRIHTSDPLATQSMPIEFSGCAESSLGQQDWNELKPKLSSDTATVFPLLHSQSSISSQWAESADFPPVRATISSNEEEKRTDSSFREEEDLSSGRYDQPKIHGTVWTFTNPPSRLGDDCKETHDEDERSNDDSSAAFSVYLDSKMTAMLLEDDKDNNYVKSEKHKNTLSERQGSPIRLNGSGQNYENSKSQSTIREDTRELNEEGNETHSYEKANGSAPIFAHYIPPLPKPLDSSVRLRSAASVVNRKINRDRFSVSDQSRIVPPPPPPSMSTFYNPVTGYSPGRSARKRIWVASNAHFPSNRATPDRHQAPKIAEDDSNTSSDVESFSSEEVLERWSAQIRAELRYAELVELAEEAERAAEAGEESYTGRPWLYAGGDNLDGALSSMPIQPSPIKRRASYSEGLPMPTSPLRVASGKTTLPPGVRNLRDAEDVFPPFGNFHKNLRTHYLRCRVAETVLVFEEVAAVEGDDQNCANVEHVNSFGTQNLMDSLNDILRRRGSPRDSRGGKIDIDPDWSTMNIKRDDSLDDDASNFGEVLAEHIHSEKQHMRRPLHPMTLPGLPPLETAQSLSIGRTVSAKHPSGHSAIGRSPSVDDDGLANPRILFPAGNPTHSLDLPGLIVDDGILATVPPATPTTHTEQSHDFVTPARLREIRRPKSEAIRKFVQEQSMILPANSVIQDSPFRSTPLSLPNKGCQQEVQANPRVPIRDLLLPAFSVGTDEDSGRMVNVASSRSYDSWDDEMAPNPLSAKDKELAAEMENNSKTPLRHSTPPSVDSKLAPGSKMFCPVTSLNLPSNDELVAAKEVKVSILDKSLDSNGTGGKTPERRIVRPSTFLAEKFRTKGQKVFTLRQFVSTTPDGSFDAIDCRCLSPAMVEDFRDRLQLDDGDDPRNQNRKTMGSSPLEGAMKILKKFNPARDKKMHQARGLFVHPRVNDDFLQNYLYCTKDPQKDEQYNYRNNVCMTNDSCENVGLCGSGFTLGGYCGFMAREVDCTSALVGGRSRDPSEILPLSFDPRKHYATDADGWFDAATERVDGILENLIGGTSHKIDRFQPPSLRKIMRPETQSSRRTDTETSEKESVTQISTTSLSGNRPSVQALFNPEEGDLSDTQFALVYGISRSDSETIKAATTSPLRDDVAGSRQGNHLPLEVPISYSSSSDEEEGRLSLSVSVSYISEPST